jgi:PKD repeat protein
LLVDFANTSTGDYATSQWDFGDGEISTLKNPTHVYTKAGAYSVSLTVSGLGGTDSMRRANYITVRSLQNPVAYLPLILR